VCQFVEATKGCDDLRITHAAGSASIGQRENASLIFLE
jgi:hypothetical protein